MNNQNKEIGIGCIAGILATTLGTFLYILFISFKKDSPIASVIDFAIKNDNIGTIVVVGALMNLIAFFLFLRKDKELRAKGVLIVTVILAVALLLYKLF